MFSKVQAPVQIFDSVIHRVNHYPEDKYIDWFVIEELGSSHISSTDLADLYGVSLKPTSQPRTQGFPPHPFFKGKVLGTWLSISQTLVV